MEEGFNQWMNMGVSENAVLDGIGTAKVASWSQHDPNIFQLIKLEFHMFSLFCDKQVDRILFKIIDWNNRDCDKQVEPFFKTQFIWFKREFSQEMVRPQRHLVDGLMDDFNPNWLL